MKRTLPSYLLGLLLFTSFSSLAQRNLTANEAADSVQHDRNAAQQLYGKDKATKQDIEQGINILNRAIHFLDSSVIVKLGEANIYLKRRKSDATRDLVFAYTLNHENEKAINALKELFNEGTSFAVLDMVKDSAFTELNADPRFVDLLNKYKQRIALWGGEAFRTPLQPDLSQADKIAGLSLLWTQARTNFAYFDHLSADWNQTYIDFIPQVQNTKSTLEYYRVLQKFYAQLHDGHTNVYFPKELSKEVNSRPPVLTELIEGRVFITQVYNDSLKKSGLTPGLELIKIDGEPVIEYANKYVKPYQSSSTPQDMDIRVYSYFLLAGALNKPVALELKDTKGKVYVKSIARSGYPKSQPIPAMEYKEIDQIGYLKINNFEDNRIVKQFDSLYTIIAKTKGLIIDVRKNGGGDSGIGNHILASLTDKPFQLFTSKHVQTDALVSRPTIGEPLWVNDGTYVQYPNGKQFYNKPVVLLISAFTFSAAEDFTVAFDYMKRGKLIGQTTGGSTGQPLRFDLPGGGTARVCGRRETYPDGKEFVGIGIKPDMVINKTVQNLYNGKDAVLAKALQILK